MTIKNRFNIGDHVYLLTDADQELYIITCIMVHPGGTVQYGISMMGDATFVHEFEIAERDL